MPDPAIHGKKPVYSALSAVEAVGRAIIEIKAQDGLTWSDIGAVFGKGEDQAAKYADGSAVMDFITFGRGKREWNGRFTGYFDRLCEESRPGKVCDHGALTAVLDCAARLSKALEDGTITEQEVRENRPQLEAARDAIMAQLAKLPVGV